MAETLVLEAEKRQYTGTRWARRTRTRNMVPVIIYGHKEKPVAAQLNYHDLALELQHSHRLLDVKLAGKKVRLLVKDVQYDHLGERIIHVDLMRVSLDERVEVTVRVELRGTPVGAGEGGVLEQVLADVELECLVTNIPESIRVPVMDMKVGQTLLARDLELPEGTTLITAADTPVATVRMKVEELEEEPAEAEEAEPEVITTREKPEEQAKESKS